MYLEFLCHYGSQVLKVTLCNDTERSICMQVLECCLNVCISLYKYAIFEDDVGNVDVLGSRYCIVDKLIS